MKSTTPLVVTKHISRLIRKIAAGSEPRYVSVIPESNALINECFHNVKAKIVHSGGRMQCGWQIWEWPSLLVEAEFHGVWVSPENLLIDITPKQDGEQRILFVPDDSLTYEGRRKDNVRMAVRDDLLIHHFIRTAEEIFEVMNRGGRSLQHGYVSIPADEIEPLMAAKQFLATCLTRGLRDHDPCQCGSGGKYKNCHGKSFPW